MEIYLEAQQKLQIPLIIGSAGGSGSQPGLDHTISIIKDIAKEKGFSFKLARIASDFDKEFLKSSLNEGKIKTFELPRDLTTKDIDSSERIVTQMGAESFIEALKMGADVIVAGIGRMTYDDTNDTYTIFGADTDIWSTSDHFHYVHKKFKEDGSIAVRIENIDPINNWTKVGVMIRDTTASDSAHAAAFITPENRIVFQYRLDAGQNAFSIRTKKRLKVEQVRQKTLLFLACRHRQYHSIIDGVH